MQKSLTTTGFSHTRRTSGPGDQTRHTRLALTTPKEVDGGRPRPRRRAVHPRPSSTRRRGCEDNRPAARTRGGGGLDRPHGRGDLDCVAAAAGPARGGARWGNGPRPAARTRGSGGLDPTPAVTRRHGGLDRWRRREAAARRGRKCTRGLGVGRKEGEKI